MRSLPPIKYGWYLTCLVPIFLMTSAYYFLAYQAISGASDMRAFLNAGMIVLLLYFLALIFHTKPYLFDPLLFLGASLMVGVILKIPYIALHREESEHLFAGQNISIFISGTYLILAALVAFLIGFKFFSILKYRDLVAYNPSWNLSRVFFISGGIIFLAIVASILAVREIGIASLLEDFSQKRFLEHDGISGRFGSSLYTYFKVALLAKIAACLLLVSILFNRSRPKKSLVILLVLSGVLSIVVPLMFGARATAVLLLIDILVIIYFSGFRPSKLFIGLAIGAGYAAFTYATLQRFGDNISVGVFESVLARRYLLDLTKTSQIISYMDYADLRFYGETLIGWLFVPIPESIFPNKPLFTNLAGWVGSNVYGFEINAVPPGFIAELYMNFGKTGVIVGMFVTGLVMGAFWRWFIPRTNNPTILVFGSMLAVRFGIFLFNNDFGTFMLKNLLETIPVTLVVYVCVSNRTRRVLPTTENVPHDTKVST